ncbi:hypothetical protein CVT24_011647 [Panaeolus cyanescens]|uniref:Uncharacterized protein n=1 Tax=Panaeolus cyanescens TaxID=181874 RepID=A0A409YH24_9AGAR|nr:hypothetical protein CVT24_011647 [Panaeolus cyanescens]
MEETPNPPHAFSPRLRFVDSSDIFWDEWRGTGLTGTAYFAARNDKVPLIVAAQKNDLQTVQHLLASEEKIKLDEVGLEGESALHMAAALGYLPVVEALIVAGANTSLQDIEGSTPLIHCARFCPPEKSVDIAKALIAGGASPLEAASYDLAPVPVLGYAIQSFNLPLTQYLTPLTPLDYPTDLPNNRYIVTEALGAASRSHNGVVILKYLLEQGLPVQTTDLCRCTDVGLTDTETSFEVLHRHFVQAQQISTEELSSLTPSILHATRGAGKQLVPAFRALVESYSVNPNHRDVAIAVLSLGQLDLLQTAINSGLQLGTVLSVDEVRQIVNGRGRGKDFLQLIRDQMGLPQP